MRKPVGLLTMVVLAGCGDIIGLNGYTDEVYGSADGGGRGGGDAGCVPTGAENCTNGIDDDCNGLGDCMDQACTTGFTCVPPLPNGWSWAAYAPDARPNCAAGFNMPRDVEEGINAANATCGCTCTTNNPSCTVGNLSITAGGNNTCDDVTTQSRQAAAGCNALSPQFTTSGESISVKGPAPSGGGCTANATKSVPSVSYQHQGRTCTYAGSSGGGCGNGNACTPKATPFTTCVSKMGTNTCPNGFPVPHFVGSMLTDTRDCTQCTCGFNAGTCGGTATFYTDTGCTQNAENVTADAQCHAVADRNWRRYSYTPQNSPSCTASAVNATGSASFSDLQTVCCTN